MSTLATAWVEHRAHDEGRAERHLQQLAGINVQPAATKIGGGLAEGLVKTTSQGFAKIGKLGLGAISAIGGGITSFAAKGGVARALTIENAPAKVKGLGQSTEAIGEIMANANMAVKGTAYGLDEAATVAAAAVASGIKPGEQLTQVLKTVGDTAQIAGMGFSDAGAIFTSVMARGKLQGDDMLQLTSRGVPVLQALSDQLGVSTQDVSEMVSKGKVDFATFATALDKYLGGSALTSGETFSGAMANVKAALSRVGQKDATPALNALRDTFNVLTPAIDKVNHGVEARGQKALHQTLQRGADGDAVGPTLRRRHGGRFHHSAGHRQARRPVGRRVRRIRRFGTVRPADPRRVHGGRQWQRRVGFAGVGQHGQDPWRRLRRWRPVHGSRHALGQRPRTGGCELRRRVRHDGQPRQKRTLRHRHHDGRPVRLEDPPAPATGHQSKWLLRSRRWRGVWEDSSHRSPARSARRSRDSDPHWPRRYRPDCPVSAACS